MSYASLAEVKSFLKISDSSQDTLLESLLASSEAFLNHYFGVDTLENSTFTERLPINPSPNSCKLRYYLKKRPVTSIEKVNGRTFTWVLGTDYIILNQRVIEFVASAQFGQYLQGLFFDTFEMEYKAGYEAGEVPRDIVLAQIMLVWAYWGESGTAQKYESYSVDVERVVYRSTASKKEFMDLIKPYRTFA